MICEKTEYGIELKEIIGNSSVVTNLRINDVLFGSANGDARIELSGDRQFLFIYTEDDYVSVAKILIDNIDIISFEMCEKLFTLYQ